MTTVSDLLTFVRVDRLNDPSSARWDDALLIRYLNEGNVDLARSTNAYKATDSSIQTFRAVSEYDAPDNFLLIESAYYQDPNSTQLFPLELRHWESMDGIWGTYQDQTSYRPAFLSTTGFAPNLTLKLYPAPSEDGGGLKLVGARLPELISNPHDPDATVDLIAGWEDAVCDYAEYKALRQDRDPRWQEAHQIYVTKRDALIHNPDYIGVNREIVPSASGSWVPAWLANGDDFY